MNEFAKRFLSSLFLILAIYLSLLNLYLLLTMLCLLGFFSFDEFIKIFKKIFPKKKFVILIIILLILSYIIYFTVVIWTFLTPLNNENIISIVFILLICSLTDIGGYMFGKIIGGKKISRISPNKTYSGVFGSFLLPMLICYIFYKHFVDHLNLNVNEIIFIFVVSFASQLGDLLISFFKRKAKIKDTGSIIPGHGGILDRIDGILIGLPLGIILI